MPDEPGHALKRSSVARLYAVARDPGQRAIVRTAARAISAYERAPLRQLLVEPHPAWALDGLLVAAGRRSLLALSRPVDAAEVPREPPPSGWGGTLLFVALWAAAIGAAALIASRLS
jgi:hypothetical protein